MPETASRARMQRSLQLQNQKHCDKRHPRICKIYVGEGSCVFGEKCEYLNLQKESEIAPDQTKIKERVDQLEQVVEDKLPEEKKMQK